MPFLSASRRPARLPWLLLWALAGQGVAAPRAAPALPPRSVAVAAAPTAPLPQAPAQPAARCVDPVASEPGGADPVAALAPGADAAQSRGRLQGLVQSAIQRSQAVGAAALLADAARSDEAEALAGKRPQASLTASTGLARLGADGGTNRQGGQAQAGVGMSGPIYDGGRLDSLGAWRRQLAEAARLGQLGTQEQVALQTVSGALERGRYQLQARVYRVHGERIQCLVQMLRQVVDADRGRESELIQVRKASAQVALSLDQTESRLQQAELRLRRFVGDELPALDGVPLLLRQLPDLAELQRQAAGAVDIVQLAAQAQAAEQYAKSVALATRPQLNWNLAGTRAVGAGSGGSSLNAGVVLNIPLLTPGQADASQAAARRAEAARLQQVDLLEARVSRLSELHAQAQAALERVQRLRAVIVDSERLRDATLRQWQQLGRRSLFDVMAAENDLLSLRVALVDALADAQQANALLWSLGVGLRDGWR